MWVRKRRQDVGDAFNAQQHIGKKKMQRWSFGAKTKNARFCLLNLMLRGFSFKSQWYTCKNGVWLQWSST